MSIAMIHRGGASSRRNNHQKRIGWTWSVWMQTAGCLLHSVDLLFFASPKVHYHWPFQICIYVPPWFVILWYPLFRLQNGNGCGPGNTMSCGTRPNNFWECWVNMNHNLSPIRHSHRARSQNWPQTRHQKRYSVFEAQLKILREDPRWKCHDSLFPDTPDAQSWQWENRWERMRQSLLSYGDFVNCVPVGHTTRNDVSCCQRQRRNSLFSSFLNCQSPSFLYSSEEVDVSLISSSDSVWKRVGEFVRSCIHICAVITSRPDRNLRIALPQKIAKCLLSIPEVSTCVKCAFRFPSASYYWRSFSFICPMSLRRDSTRLSQPLSSVSVARVWWSATITPCYSATGAGFRLSSPLSGLFSFQWRLTTLIRRAWTW
jgi:hypothetical protein